MAADDISRYRQWVVLLVVAGLAVLVRVPFFGWPLISDEGGYAYTAYWWLRGLTLYSGDLWLDRPQGIFVAYFVPILLSGATWVIRLWGALWAAGTAVFVYLLAARLSGRRTAVTAGVLFAVFSALPQIEGFTANAEVFMLLPATAGAYCLLRGRYGWAGVLASAAFLLKPSGVSSFLLAGMWLFHLRGPFRHHLRFGLAALPLILAAFVHGVATVGLEAYLFAVVVFRTYVEQDPWTVAMIASSLRTAPAWLPLTFMGVYGCRSLHRTSRIFVLLWLLTSALGMVPGGGWYRHYYIQIIPPLSVLAGEGLGSLLASKRAGAKLGTAVLTAVSLTLFVFLAVQSPREGADILYRRPGYRIADRAASYIREHTGDADLIYVAFNEAEIYHLAGRRSSFPYLYRIHVQFYPGAYAQAVQVIARREPLYVLALDRLPEVLDPNNEFQSLLEAGYEVEAAFDGIPLYRRLN